MCYPDPSYHGEAGEVSAVHTPGDGPPDLKTSARTSVRYLATGDSTGRRFGLYRWSCEPNTPGPNPHFHRTMSESFFVLDGTLRIYDGDRWAKAGAGDFLYVPEGGIHAFENAFDQPMSMLILFSPGAPREAYFEAGAELAAGRREFTPEQWREICLSHDNIFIEPLADDPPLVAPWRRYE